MLCPCQVSTLIISSDSDIHVSCQRRLTPSLFILLERERDNNHRARERERERMMSECLVVPSWNLNLKHQRQELNKEEQERNRSSHVDFELHSFSQIVPMYVYN